MRHLLLAAVLFTAAGCGPRQVLVTTGPQPESEISIRVTNNLSQAVNFYIRSGASDIFVKQISANSVEWVPVEGFRPGTTVTLVARPVSGTPTYSHAVVLEQSMEWQIP
jgi:hypothetical protein